MNMPPGQAATVRLSPAIRLAYGDHQAIYDGDKITITVAHFIGRVVSLPGLHSVTYARQPSAAHSVLNDHGFPRGEQYDAGNQHVAFVTHSRHSPYVP
jgi:hypothetical protein